MSKGIVTILGCGNSSGVPALGNHWGQCDPNEPKNRRTRSSVHVQYENTSLVIDTGPEFRTQINRENIPYISAVLYTHCHGDHVSGIDDIRIIRHKNGELVDVYADTETLEGLSKRFSYIFQGGLSELYPPIANLHPIKPENYGQPFQIKDCRVIPVLQDHGTIMATGYRIGDFAYCLDMVDLPTQSIETLKGIKTWIVDAAGYHNDNNLVHASLNKIIELNKTIGAEKVYISSLSLEMDYQTLVNELPSHIIPCYDGLKIEFEI